MSTTKYDEDFKKSLVTLHQSRKTQAQLCREYGVSESALCQWVKQYATGANRRRRGLDRQTGERASEAKCPTGGGKPDPKKSDCHLHATLRERLNAVHLLRYQHQIKTLCRVLRVNRSTYYKHFSQAPAPRVSENQRIKTAMLQIDTS